MHILALKFIALLPIISSLFKRISPPDKIARAWVLFLSSPGGGSAIGAE